MKAVIILLNIAIIVFVLAIFRILALQRRKKLAAYAATQGWQFSILKDKNLQNRYSAFKCLRRGHSRYAHNIMQGKREQREVTAFDYHYVTGHGKSRRVHHFSAVIVRSPFPLKPLYLRRENIFDRMTDFFGFDDIDFESAEFSRKFYVKAPEKRWAYDVIHTRMMEYLLGAPRFNFQFDTADIIAWRNQRFSEEDFDDAFALIQGVLSRIPDYVKGRIERA